MKKYSMFLYFFNILFSLFVYLFIFLSLLSLCSHELAHDCKCLRMIELCCKSLELLWAWSSFPEFKIKSKSKI